jgi:serine/threonine-protein kinase HipA
LLEYLYFAGDDRLGALGVSTSASEYVPAAHGPLPHLEDAQAIGNVVAKIEEGQPVSQLEARVVQAGGSLGGAKPKALVQIDGAPWLLKFNSQGSHVDTSLIEHATMRLAAKAGIDVASTHAVRLIDGHAIAVRRFDRAADGGRHRTHTLSAGTALRAANVALSDFGYPELAQLLRRRGAAQTMDSDAAELFRRMVFNILMDNTDDHEKNHALLVPDPWSHGSLKLAPAYDVLPSMSGQVHQQFRCGAQGAEASLANAMSECEAFGLTPQAAAVEVARLIGVVDGWEEHFRSAGVADADMQTLKAWVDADAKRSERRGFAVEAFGRSKRTRRRVGPFAGE